ncbi:TVP38/TMEM64 family protein [Exiguobacterium sp. AM39-5BH]|uniref:TVP38/TMEM64 family protein n=1 Tax=Exiguobacterium sp. AM39-5BH TaxID=2292355 RepID=UPI000FE1D9AD|nr:TVP38/TMEM64 family protein [Exiguobacterium sp. AM39-5BH]RHB49287.1 TVP38/TMEM64 family protein [Exiguobacterium sp. AM39-5BH]
MPRPLKLSLILTVFGSVFYITHFHYELRPSDVRDIVLSFGWWGPVIFFIIYAIGPLIFLPTSVLSLGAGLAFGVWPGILYILFGATAAAVTGYVMARLFGRSILKVESYPWSERLFTQMEQRGFLYVFVLRLIPLVSFDLLSYAAGIANVQFKSFLLATVLGMIPGTLAYSFLGASLASGSITLIVIAALVFVTLLGAIYYFREPVKRWLGLTSD